MIVIVMMIREFSKLTDDDDDDDDDVADAVHSSPHDVMVRTTSSTARVTWLPAHNLHHHYHYVLWYISSSIHACQPRLEISSCYHDAVKVKMSRPKPRPKPQPSTPMRKPGPSRLMP